MPAARLIVCETTSKWAVALRRQLPLEGRPAIFETRSLDDCWRQVLASPASLVVLEVTTANLEQLAAELPKYRTRVPRVRVVVLGSRRLAAAEWLLRELGAVHVVFSTRAMGSLVGIIQRHWSRIAGEEPPQKLIPWRQLPWSRSGAAAMGGPRREGQPIAEPDWLVDDRR